jgi:hypothetical protein
MDELDLLVAEPLHERHVLIRHRDEAGMDLRLVGVAPVEPGQLLVLATPDAHEVPALVPGLPTLLADFLDGIESVWVGVGGLAESTQALEWLAEELGAEIVAPDGGVAAMPGAALYAGHSAGGTGWYAAGELLGARFPLPDWESWVPDAPVEVAGITAVPVPCGLAIGGDAAFEVPVNQRFPKLVLCEPVPPAAIAALLGGLPDQPIMVVPSDPSVATHIWQAELAMRLARDVVFSAGTQVRTRSGALSTFVPDADGHRLFRPFPLVLQQNARGGDQQVLDVAAAPPGWERDGRRSYRLSDGGAVIADVVPSGLVLRAADGTPADPAADAAPFDPEGWTLTLGMSGHAVGRSVLAAAEDLLTVLPAEQRAAVRVRMAGAMDTEAEHALDRFAGARKRTSAVAPASEVDDGLAGRGFVVAPPEPQAPVDAQVAGGSAAVAGPVDVRTSGRPVAPGGGLVASVDARVASGSVAPVAGPVGARPSSWPVAPVGGVSGPGGRSVVPAFEQPVRAAHSVGGAYQPPAAAPVAGAYVAGPPSLPTPPPAPSASPASFAPPASPTPPAPSMSPPAPSAPPVSPPASFAAPASPAGASSAPSVGAPPVMTMSGAPVSTVSGAPAPVRPRESEVPPAEPVGRQEAQPERPPEVEATRSMAPPAAAAPQAAPVREPEPRPAAREPEPRPAGRSLAVPVRASSASEQARFTSAAGESFTEALATVNAAMATWPSIRMDESPGAKADYVAVCLFLGRGDSSASSVNGAVRVGQAGVLDGQVPCLMSGIRRLPTHRRAVLRQGKVNESLEHVSTPGTVLTEPGFLAGSIELDVTVPGADLDVLIWPSTARRTSELMLARPVDEAVFLAGARFKALAMRTAEEKDDQEDGADEDDGAPVAPRVAVLYRELAPGETPTTAELDERDLAVLAKLDGVLARRHRGSLRLVEDADVAARLTTSMIAWQQEAAAVAS